ncbi:MAG: prephenate dehydratase [Burkholderiaceae bacterium]
MDDTSPDARLAPLREAIDSIDTQLVALLNQRAEIARQVGEVKGTVGAPVFRPEREAEVIRKVVAKSGGPLPDASVGAVFREIMSACRALERPLAIAYLGPAGTFSEAAMVRQFGTSVNGVPCATLDEVFRAAEAGTVDFAIVPMENSTEGAVSRTLDLLLATPLKIIGEVSIPVHHNLLTATGTLEGITRVAAHSQALAQCAGWLNENVPQLDRQGVASNGEAARLAASDRTLAAIAGEAAASRYGLQIAAAHIQDDASNRTRFVVLGFQDTTPSKAPGKDKTSLILSVPNKAGAVFHVLSPLATHGVSMSRLESRPARTGTWAYYFYVDVEGHALDEKVARALDELKAACAFYKNLGSYPAEA